MNHKNNHVHVLGNNIKPSSYTCFSIKVPKILLSQPTPEGTAMGGNQKIILKIFTKIKIIENVMESPPVIYLRKRIRKTF